MHQFGKRFIPKREVHGRGFVNKVLKYLPCEFHVPGYQYCGPGTDLYGRLARGDSGINALDRACKRHDIAYIYNTTPEQIKKVDDYFLNEVNERITAEDSTWGERNAARFIRWIMKKKEP